MATHLRQAINMLLLRCQWRFGHAWECCSSLHWWVRLSEPVLELLQEPSPTSASMISSCGSWPKPCRGSAALALLVRDGTPDRVIERHSHAPNARLVKTNLSHTDEDKLRELLKGAAQQAEALRLS